MAETANASEQQVRAMIAARLAHQSGDDGRTDAQDETGGRRVIDVDLYHLEGGAVLLVPNNGTNPLDTNAVESERHTLQERATPDSETLTLLLVVDEQRKEEPVQDVQQEPAGTGTKRQLKPSFVLVSLVLICILTAGIATYLFLLPLTAIATVTITPKARSLHSGATFTIAANPKTGQVQGRPLVASSFTRSKTVPATGHAHDDATISQGIITFYNADSSSYTIPAGVTLTTSNGQTVVTDNTVTVQAAVLPEVGIAITSAHVIQAGSVGNIAAHSIYTRCCGSQFVTATNTTPFTGGQDARSYSFIQSSDIHNAATDLLQSLTLQATETLQKQARPGEQLVTPLCSSRTQESAEPGTEGASVTVSVTQTCSSVAYLTDSLNQIATSTFAHMATLSNFEEVGTTQVTVNASTYTGHTASLKVSFSGVWVYRFTQMQVTHLTKEIAGESQEKAKATLAKVDGVAQVSIHLQRLDFTDQLPTNPQRIHMQFFYIVL